MVQHTCPCGYETKFKANLRRHQSSSRCDEGATQPSYWEAREAKFEHLLRLKDARIQILSEQLALVRSAREEEPQIHNNVNLIINGEERLSQVDAAEVLELVRRLCPHCKEEELR